MTSKSKHLHFAALFLAGAPLLHAGPVKEVAPPPMEQASEKNWELRVTVPGWLASLEGESGVLGRTVDVDTPFDELIDEIDMIFALAVDFRYERLLFAADGSYSEVSYSAEPTGVAGLLFNNATVDMKAGMFEAYLGYRVVDTEAVDWDIFAGLRYNYSELTITLDGTERRSPRTGRELALTRDRKGSAEHEWVDPLVATRLIWYFTPAVSLILAGDIGGFEVSSDLTWQAYAALRADVTRSLYLEAGYRHQKTDYTDGGFIMDTAMTGPQIILGLRF